MVPAHRRVCASCGAGGELHRHHLIPRVVGAGAGPTVMLCLACHGLVHDRVFRPGHAALTRLGLEAAKARGVKLGGRNLQSGFDPAEARAGRAMQAARSFGHASRVMPGIEAAVAGGARTLREICAALDAAGIPTPRAVGSWQPSQVGRIFSKAGFSGARAVTEFQTSVWDRDGA